MPLPQSADKARNRKNRSDIQKIRGDFCFLRQLHLHPAVTYVHVSSLGCKFASLACGLSQHSGGLLTLSTSWGSGLVPLPLLPFFGDARRARKKRLHSFALCGILSLVPRVMTIGSRAASCCESCQGRKAAALNRSWRAPRGMPGLSPWDFLLGTKCPRFRNMEAGGFFSTST